MTYSSSDEIKLAILLRDFCCNCKYCDKCNDMGKCKAVEFAEYLVDKRFVNGKLLL